MKIEKNEKLVANLHDKNEYVIHIRNLKQALNLGLVLKKLHRIIKFKQKTWLKSNVGINTHLKKKQKRFDEICSFLKNYKKCEKTGILILLQQKEEETIWCQNQVMII